MPAELARTLAALFLLLFATAAVAGTIEPGDDITVNVAAWDPTTGQMTTWSGWTTQYHVGADGSIVLPVLGQTKVAQLTPNVLSTKIAAGLTQQLSLSKQMAVTVAITKRPPVLVLGLVSRAGPVEFREGMTVREALALAGGVPQFGLNSQGPMRQMQELLAAQGLLDQLRQKEDELSSKVARLRAESDGQSTISFPPMLVGGAQTDAMMARERKIFALNSEKQKRALALIDGRIALFKTQIKALQEQVGPLQDQQAASKKQVKAMSSLSSERLALASNLLSAQRTYTAIEAQALQVQNAILSAQQNIAQAESDRLQIVQGQKTSALENLQKAQSDLAQTRSQRQFQEKLVALLGVFQEQLGIIQAPDKGLQVTINRRGSDAAIPATLDQVLQPGDVVQFALDPARSTNPGG